MSILLSLLLTCLSACLSFLCLSFFLLVSCTFVSVPIFLPVLSLCLSLFCSPRLCSCFSSCLSSLSVFLLSVCLFYFFLSVFVSLLPPPSVSVPISVFLFLPFFLSLCLSCYFSACLLVLLLVSLTVPRSVFLPVSLSLFLPFTLLPCLSACLAVRSWQTRCVVVPW